MREQEAEAVEPEVRRWKQGMPRAAETFWPAVQTIVLLATLELAVDDGRGTHLLVTRPRYEPLSLDGRMPLHESGQWTPAHVSRSLTSPSANHWEHGSLIRDAITRGWEEWNGEQRLAEMTAGWSCRISDLEYVGEFSEEKTSWGAATSRKLYSIRRYRPRRPEACEPTALADAGWRKGFFFLPIDEGWWEAATALRTCPTHGRDEMTFLDQPLATNLRYLLEDPDVRADWRERPVKLEPVHFASRFEGLLVSGDVAGYGAACRYVNAHMQQIDRDGDDFAQHVRDWAVEAFTRVFHEAGLPHVHIAGDGFIAGRPLDDGQDVAKAVERFRAAFGRLLAELEELNRRLEAHHAANGNGPVPPVMGSRLAFHWGEWRYGKIARAASIGPAFDGPDIIGVARLEQGLSGLAKDPGRNDVFGGRRHTVIVGSALTDRDGVLEVFQELEPCGPATVSSKEDEQAGALFAWKLP
jgi:hypothetical protein